MLEEQIVDPLIHYIILGAIEKQLRKRNTIDKILNTCLDIRPESRARPKATQQGCAKCGGGTSALSRSCCRKKFQRKADKKIDNQKRVNLKLSHSNSDPTVVRPTRPLPSALSFKWT